MRKWSLNVSHAIRQLFVPLYHLVCLRNPRALYIPITVWYWDTSSYSGGVRVNVVSKRWKLASMKIDFSFLPFIFSSSVSPMPRAVLGKRITKTEKIDHHYLQQAPQNYKTIEVYYTLTSTWNTTVTSVSAPKDNKPCKKAWLTNISIPEFFFERVREKI